MRHISHNKKSRKIGTREAVRTTFYIFTEGKRLSQSTLKKYAL